MPPSVALCKLDGGGVPMYNKLIYYLYGGK